MLLAFIFSCQVAAPPSQLAQSTPPAAHTFTFHNACSQPVWVGSHGQSGTPSLSGGGWYMAPNEKRAVSVPIGNSGRVWPRTVCTFPGDGLNHCESGGCLDATGVFGEQCAQTGVPPAALIEWTLDAPSGNGPIDYYDASLVDGWSVTAQMTADAGTFNPVADPGMDQERWCAMGGCAASPVCPTEYVDGANCASPCQHDNTEKACCTCSLTTPVTCPDAACASGYGCSPYHAPAYPADMVCDPWSSDPARAWSDTQKSYITAVHAACPSAYAWQFDDTKGTFNCRKDATAAGAGLVNYTITFCPGVP